VRIKSQAEIFHEFWEHKHSANLHGTMSFTLPDTPELAALKQEIRRRETGHIEPAPRPRILERVGWMIAEARRRMRDERSTPRGEERANDW